MQLKDLTLARYAELRGQTKLPPAELEALQKQKLLKLVGFARANNPFYRKLLPDLTKKGESLSLVEILPLLPIMDRKFIQDNYAALKTFIPGVKESDYGVSITSGSTGQPVRVAKYRPEYLSSYYGITLLEWEWHQRDINKRMGMLRLGVEDEDERLIGPPISYLGKPAVGFQYRSDGRPVDDLLLALIRLKPAYLFCNAITLRLVAKEMLTGNYPKLEIDQILSVSDPVDQNFRDLMKEAFNAKVIDRYSTEELGLFGVECPASNHVHIMAPDFILELLDESGQPVPPGKPGRVIVTALESSGMPLFRYDLADLAIADLECPIGITWPSLTQIVGRIRDYIDFPDGRKSIATFVKSTIVGLPDLYDFQAILFSDTILLIAGVKQPLSAKSKQEISSELSRIFGEHLRVEIRETTQLPLLKPVKRSEFIRRADKFWEAADPADYLKEQR